MNRFRTRSVDVRTQILLHFCLLYGVTFLIVLPISCYQMKDSAFFWHDDPSSWIELRHRDEQRLFTGEHFLSAMRLRQKLPWRFDHARYPGKYSKGEPNPQGIDLHVLVVTVNRNAHQVDKYEPRYLTQTVTTFLRQFEAEFQMHVDAYRRVNLTVCNVESMPQRYTEAQRMAHYVDVIHRYEPSPNDTGSRFNGATGERKVIEDFVYCMASSVQRYRNRLLLVLHDDMLPSDTNFFQSFRELVHQLLPSELGEFYSLNVGMVKMHHPAGLLGFASLPASDLFLLFFTLFCFSLTVTLLYFRYVLRAACRERERRESGSLELPAVAPRHVPGSGSGAGHFRVLSSYDPFERSAENRARSVTNLSVIARLRKFLSAYRRTLLCSSGVFIYALLVCAALGAPNVLRLRRLYAPFGNDQVLVADTFSCCYRALLFSELSAREFVEFASRTLHISYHFDESLQRITDGFDEDFAAHAAGHNHESVDNSYSLDTLLNAFVNAGTFRSYSLLPSSMEHVGLYPAYSSLLRSTLELDW